MAPRKATGPTPSASQTQQDASSEGIEDFELPKVLITQLAKSAIPKDTRLDDETITALVKGSTVFITHLAATAQEIAASRAHKTISGADVLKALETLEFGELVNAFQSELEVFRQESKVDKGRTKDVVDPKGRDKGTDPLPSSVKLETAQLGAAVLINANHPRDICGSEIVANGALATDVEMGVQDVNEHGPLHDVKVVLPMGREGEA